MSNSGNYLKEDKYKLYHALMYWVNNIKFGTCVPYFGQDTRDLTDQQKAFIRELEQLGGDLLSGKKIITKGKGNGIFS